MKNTEAIKATNLSIGYPKRTVLTDISFSIPPGSVTAVIGANGTGKSTLLKTLSGVISPLDGTVELNGRDLSTISRRELAKLMAIVYTDRTNGAGGLTVRELVELGRYPHTGYLGHLTANDRNIVEESIVSLGIESKATSFLSDISDGERQKAMIARALAQETPVILLDEPTSYLDAASRLDILDLVRRLADTHGRTILLSTHDTAPSLAISDIVMTIAPTETPAVAVGTPDDVQFAERMNRIFPNRGISFNPLTRDFEKNCSIEGTIL
ncbi:MAG: ABC transporter ATP-binding protein [Muribaculaceae bacterium]|nr:ABC transporter ATP-binding protein [Muribaculaceae bacterium]